ncbi:ECF-type sigma factor [Hellea sp.]|nr:ECF-type sigma factor [Hellea sp.]
MGFSEQTKIDDDITSLLKAWRDGSTNARDQLFSQLYKELRLLSAALLRNEGRISLSTGDLVNDAAARLIRLDNIDWQDKAHFMALSARMMRRVLVDHARKKDADKRHHQKVTLVTHLVGGGSETVSIQKLEHALLRLNVIDPVRAEIVEMRYYGGMSLEEIGAVVDMSPSTIKRNWRASRAWLLSAMQEDGLES